MNVNKQCMEDILQYLRQLICLTDAEKDIDTLARLVDLANETSAQLSVITEINCKYSK